MVINIRLKFNSILFVLDLAFISISIAIYALKENSAKGYEFSIYDSTSWIVWFSLIFCFLCLTYIFYRNIIGKSWSLWVPSFLLLLICKFVLNSIYALRNYLYLDRYDCLSYIGMALDVNIYGQFKDNIYPITSMLLSMISNLANIGIVDISKYLPSIFLTIFTLSIYSLSKSTYDNRESIFLATLASMPIYYAWFSTTIFHMLLATLTLPLFVLSLQKSSDIRFNFISIILCIIYPFFHPLVAMTSFTIVMGFYLNKKLIKCEKTCGNGVTINLVLVSAISIISWFIIQFYLIRETIHIIAQIVNPINEPTTFTEVQGVVSTIGFSTIVKTVFLTQIDEIIFFSLSLLSICYFIFRKDYLKDFRFLNIAIIFLGSNLFTFVLFVTTYSHNAERLLNLNPAMTLSPVLIGYLYNFLKLNKIKLLILLVLISISSLTTMFSLYESPITFRPNAQVTISEVMGMKWIASEKNLNISTANIMTPLFRYADMIYGVTIEQDRRDLYSEVVVPEHFGTKTESKFKNGEDLYLIISLFDVYAYTEVWRDIHKFDLGDFIRLDKLFNANKIYDNIDIRYYLINKEY